MSRHQNPSQTNPSQVDPNRLRLSGGNNVETTAVSAALSRIRAQARIELLLTLRRGESLVVTIGIPILFLVFFSRLDVAGAGTRSIDFVVPGILALSIIATSMVSFAISTGFDRQYGVLKLLGGSPLTRPELIVAKICAILAIQIVQIAIVLALSFALDWAPGGSYLAAVVTMIVGSVAFSGLGLWMAGTLRAEGTLALANGLFVLFILIGGIVFPIDRLPAIVADVGQVLPAAAFAEALRQAFAGAPVFTSAPFWLLVVWAVVFVTVAAATFKWE